MRGVTGLFENTKNARGRFVRKIEILYALSRRRFEKMDNFVREFGVSYNTIRRDIYLLSLCFPIYTRQGKGGGVYVCDGWYFGIKYFSTEQEAYLSSLLFEIGESKGKTLESIIADFSKPVGKHYRILS